MIYSALLYVSMCRVESNYIFTDISLILCVVPLPTADDPSLIDLCLFIQLVADEFSKYCISSLQHSGDQLSIGTGQIR